MRLHTVEDLNKDLLLLSIYEGNREVTQAALAGSVGLSQPQLSRRLARARRYRAELARQAQRELRQQDAPGEMGRDPEELPYVPFVDGSEYGYDLHTDRCSVESGAARFGNRNGSTEINGMGATHHPEPPIEGQRLQVRSVNGGVETEPDGPTKYEPDPGLKGGVG